MSFLAGEEAVAVRLKVNIARDNIVVFFIVVCISHIYNVFPKIFFTRIIKILKMATLFATL